MDDNRIGQNGQKEHQAAKGSLQEQLKVAVQRFISGWHTLTGSEQYMVKGAFEAGWVACLKDQEEKALAQDTENFEQCRKWRDCPSDPGDFEE